MKKTFLFILYGLLLTACGDIPTNGDLDGMWHLRSIETLSDHHWEDVKEKRIYYSVQLRLINLRKAGANQYIGRFALSSDSLILKDFVIYQQESQKATAEELAPFGLNGTISRFAIKTLNNKQMVLRSNETELTFKKF